MPETDKFEIISEIARRRGFFWQSNEIYGGTSGFITFGPLGAILKRRIEDKFRDFFIHPLGILDIESPVIMPEKVLEASGHVEHFKEPMVECQKCKRKFRADHVLQEQAKMSDTETEKLSLDEIMLQIKKHKVSCPDCGGELGNPKHFMTMFTTTIGPYSDAVGYGRPEAAQGIFVEFKRLHEIAREKLPFGVVQIGHALRNEISPRQGPIRVRELTIIDIEFFFDPEEPDCPLLKDVENEKLRLILAEHKLKGKKEPIEATVKEALKKGYIKTEWQAFFMAMAKRFLMALGVPEDKQRFIEKLEWERAHYSVQGFDQEIFLDRWGWTEVSGHNYRADYDLKRHMEFSGVDMRTYKEYEKPITKEELVVKPLMATLGQSFKGDSSKIAKILSTLDPKVLETSFNKKGFFEIEAFKILPEHIEIFHKEVEEKGRRFIPHVVEPSFGSDRLTYIALEYAYRKQKDRVLLSFPREIAPVQVGIFPLMNKDGLPEKAKEVHDILLKEGFAVEYDDSGSIGRRYARADEVGMPLGLTVDYDTFKDGTVTLRDRDTWDQVRTEIVNLPMLLYAYFHGKTGFRDLGKLVKS